MKKKINKMADGFKFIRELIDELTGGDEEKIPLRFCKHCDILEAMEELFEESAKKLEGLASDIEDLANSIVSEASDIEIDDNIEIEDLYASKDD